MKVKIDTEITKLDGTKIIDENGSNSTLKSIMVRALTNSLDTDGALTGEKKFELYNVANKINSCKKEVELTVEEIALIKERIGKSFIIEVIGQAWNLLEAKEKD